MAKEICALATDWDGKRDLRGWLLSEKLDGVAGKWTGEKFLTRHGNVVNCPEWFKQGMPKGVELDGQFWTKRGDFDLISGIVRRGLPRIGGAEWKPMRFHVFDAPRIEAGASHRLAAIPHLITGAKCAIAVQHVVAPSNEAVLSLLEYVLTKGGEGLMAIEPDAHYRPGARATDFLKVKVWQEAEALVVKRNTAKDSILCVLPNGVEFDVGLPSVFDRAHPPKKGEKITFRYWNFNESGKPKHPTYKGVRDYE